MIRQDKTRASLCTLLLIFVPPFFCDRINVSIVFPIRYAEI